jgi:hypothetical protein
VRAGRLAFQPCSCITLTERFGAWGQSNKPVLHEIEPVDRAIRIGVGSRTEQSAPIPYPEHFALAVDVSLDNNLPLAIALIGEG